MPLQDVRIYQGQPGTAEGTIYTVGTGNTHVKLHKMEVVMANTTANDSTVSLSLVPSGGVAGVTNRILPSVKVPANSVASIKFNQFMSVGDFLSALQGTAGAITLTISGVIE